MTSNKRSAGDWPTSQSKRPNIPDHANTLREEQIKKIFCNKIDQSVEKCFAKIITDIKNYEDEKDLLQCIDELPNIEDIDDEHDKLTSEVSIIGNDSEAIKETAIDDYVPAREKLNKYYKIIDKLLLPKIKKLIESHRSEFQEILEYDKAFVLEKTKIILQLQDDLDKSLRDANICKIRDYIAKSELDVSENNDDDKKDYLHNDMYEDMDSQNDVCEEISSEHDDVDEEWYTETDDIEDINLEHNKIDEGKISQNHDVFEEINCKRSDKNEDKTMDKEMERLVFNKSNVMSEPDKVFGIQEPPDQIERSSQDGFLKGNVEVKQEPNDEMERNCQIKMLQNEVTVKQEPIEANERNFEIETTEEIATIKQEQKDDRETYSEVEMIEETAIIKQEPIEANERNFEIETTEEIATIKQEQKDDRETYSEVEMKEETAIIKQEPIDERESKSEIGMIDEVPIVKQESKHELIYDRSVKVKKERDTVTDTAPVNMLQSKPMDNLQFIVKLTANPVLPERETAAKFIKKYNPTAIKKHKKINNVLYITFANQTDCKNFLSMNGHCINLSTFAMVRVQQNVKTGASCNTVAKEHLNVGENSKTKHALNDTSVKNVEVNNEKDLGSPKSGVSTINTMDVQRNSPKKTAKYLEGSVHMNLKEFVSEKIIETFSEIAQNNKETNGGLLSCKENGTSDEHLPNIYTKNDKEIKHIEDIFYKRLSVLKDNILTILNQDDEYVAIKNVITQNTKSLYKN